MNRFTVEETNLLSIYSGDKQSVTDNITAALPYMDADIRELAGVVVRKLQAVTDSEFSEMRFTFTDDE